MEGLFRQKIIEERYESNYLAYILKEKTLFFMTGYKVLQSQEKNGFVRCTKILHNGKDKLVYDIAGYKTLASLMQSLSAEKFLTVIANFIQVIEGVHENGFMHCDYIVMDFERIYEKLTEKLKSSLLKAFMQYPELLNSSSQILADTLQQTDCSLIEIQKVLDRV